MFISPRCNYAGSFGQPIPTRSSAFVLFARLRRMARLLAGRR